MALIDELLEDLRIRGVVFSRMTLRGDWGFAKARLEGAPFHLILSGEGWIELDGEAPRRLGAGDIAILPQGRDHRLLSRPGAPTEPWRSVVAREGLDHWTPGTRFKTTDLVLGEGEPATVLISGVFAFRDPRRSPLLEALPPVMTLAVDAGSLPARALGDLTRMLAAEIAARQPGAESVSGRLAELLFIQVIRHHLAITETLPPGWLRGMTDPGLAAAVAAIHRAPERAWTVASLAQEVGMSRARFAARFAEAIGQPPLDYLTGWRMYRAAGRLMRTRAPLTEIASKAGYRSEVAFGKAFKRWAGVAPMRYRQAHAADGVAAVDESETIGPER